MVWDAKRFKLKMLMRALLARSGGPASDSTRKKRTARRYAVRPFPGPLPHPASCAGRLLHRRAGGKPLAGPQQVRQRGDHARHVAHIGRDDGGRAGLGQFTELFHIGLGKTQLGRRHAAVGHGCRATHGYERTHIDSLRQLYGLLKAYILG